MTCSEIGRLASGCTVLAAMQIHQIGNLLCAVVNLLNDPAGLARLLNDILAILG